MISASDRAQVLREFAEGQRRIGNEFTAEQAIKVADKMDPPKPRPQEAMVGEIWLHGIGPDSYVKIDGNHWTSLSGTRGRGYFWCDNDLVNFRAYPYNGPLDKGALLSLCDAG